LRRRVAENTADYFIHKDLGRFLSGELDYYLKSQVLGLDAMFAAGSLRAPAQFQLVQAVRDLGRDIINFLAQLENFQKALFEKRKFVTECHWCFTLDWVEKAALLDELTKLLNTTAGGRKQTDEWKHLFAIQEAAGFAEPITSAFLRSQQFLVLDTKFLPSDFTDKLLATLPPLEENTNGLLIHSENFHALTLIGERYRESLKSIYIDPPFDTESNAILYKNAYRHSSWLALVIPRLALSMQLEQPRVGVHTIAIDDAEKDRLALAVGELVPNRDIITVTVVHTLAARWARTSQPRMSTHYLFSVMIDR
jgi:adenine-specific DNA-methyltransferase